VIRFHDLAGADPARRFSPYCWRVRMALLHKGLAFEALPWRFTERAVLAELGQTAVPVLLDGDRGDKVVGDSFAIADYLEETRPGSPLFAGPAGRRQARFMKHWVESQLQPMVSRMISLDLWARLGPADQAYFRQSREQRWGMPLEQLVAGREATREAFGKALAPLRLTLAEAPFVGGQAPDFGDYIAFGMFMWARCGSDFPVLAEGDADRAADPVVAWRARLLSLHGGHAASLPSG
jgi:glutathione S-transferase